MEVVKIKVIICECSLLYRIDNATVYILDIFLFPRKELILAFRGFGVLGFWGFGVGQKV